MKLPLLVPRLPTADRLMPLLRRIDDARRYTNFGPLNAEFESLISRQCGTPENPVSVTTVANATLGLELALLCLGLKKGSTVAVPALTFVATATAVLRAGYVPVICDVDSDSWSLTPDTAAKAVAAEAAQAVIPVATFGMCMDPDAWDTFSASSGVPVIIDAAGSFGAQVVGRYTDVVFSFHATKALGIGEGGAFASSNSDRVAHLRKLSNFGIDVSRGIVDEPGSNAKLSEYHAAVGLAALDDWDEKREQTRQLSRLYREVLRYSCPAVRFQQRPVNSIDALMPILLPQGACVNRTATRLAEMGIETRRWYCPLLNEHPAFAGLPRTGLLQSASDIGRYLIGLPFHLDLGEAELLYIASALRRALEQA